MPESRILLGVIGRPHGVRGLVRVTSHTADPADLTAYGPLSDDHGRLFTLRWRGDGVVELAQMVDGVAVKVADRAAAEQLTNTRLYVERTTLPAPQEDEFYLADLVGLTALDTAGTTLGTVVAVHDYGAGASLEVARPGGAPLLVPFTRAAVPDVDLARGHVKLDPPSPLAGEDRDEGADHSRPTHHNAHQDFPTPQPSPQEGEGVSRSQP